MLGPNITSARIATAFYVDVKNVCNNRSTCECFCLVNTECRRHGVFIVLDHSDRYTVKVLFLTEFCASRQSIKMWTIVTSQQTLLMRIFWCYFLTVQRVSLFYTICIMHCILMQPCSHDRQLTLGMMSIFNFSLLSKECGLLEKLAVEIQLDLS